MDELAFWCDYTSLTKDDYTIFNEVVRPIPTDSPDTKIFGATTPNGASGLSYDLMPIDGHQSIFELMWFPYFYREEENYTNEIKLIEQEYIAKGRHESFRQEYLAELVTKNSAYFKEIEVSNVFNPSLNMYTSYTGDCELGLDFGGSVKSRTVITISVYDKKNNRCYRIYHKRYPVGEDSTLQADILDMMRRFPAIKRYHIDSQGGGSSFYAWFRNQIGTKLDEVSFRGEKADMYRLFKIACYQERIKSYIDSDLLEEMNGFTADLKPSKHTTDDLLDSFVMSCKDWLEEKDTVNYGVVKY
jgi:hypothetical protein